MPEGIFNFKGEDVKVTNFSGGSEELPAIVNLRMPNLGGIDGGPGAPTTFEESFMDTYNKSEGREKIESIPLSSISADKRYPYVFRGSNPEEMYGQQQHWTEKAYNDTVKFGALVGTTIAGGFGMLYGTAKWLTPGGNGKFSDIWDNPIMHSLDKINQELEQELPNYYTESEKNAEWYSKDNWLTANFLFDKVIKNSGFAVGAMLSGNIANGAIEGLGSGIGSLAARGLAKGVPLATSLEETSQGFKLFTPLLRGTARAFSVGKNAEAAAILREEASSMADIASKSTKLLDITKQQAKFAGWNDAGRRTAIAAYSSAGESTFEALQTSNEFRNKLISDYFYENGKQPEGAELDKIDELSRGVGKMSFWANMGLLTVTEFQQLRYLQGSSYTKARKAANELLSKADDAVLKEGKYVSKVDEAAPSTRFGKVYKGISDTTGKLLKGKSTYLFDPKEMGQEIGQYAIQVGTENYYNKAYRGKEAQGIIDTIAEVGGYGLFGENEKGEGVGALVSKEGLESGLIGGLTGGPMQAMGLYAEKKQAKEHTTAFLKELNNAPTLKQALVDKIDAVNRGVQIQKDHQTAVLANDKLEATDSMTDLLHNYLAPRIKYGKFDMITQDLKELKMAAMENNGEGLKSLLDQETGNVEDTLDTFTKRITKIEDTAQAIHKAYEYMNTTYGGETMTGKDGKQYVKYTPEVIDKMVYAMTKIADYDKRLPELAIKLTSSSIPADSIIKEVLKEGKVDLLNEGLETIRGVEDPVTKKELEQLLLDSVDLGMRRKKFINELNELIDSPDKYKKAVPNSIRNEEDQDLGTIKLKTKSGETDYVIGKKYFLNEIVDYTTPSKEGGETHPVFRTPTVKILGKNEDGTIKMYDVATQETFNVSPDKLEQYDLVEKDKVVSNALAKFAMKNRNKIYEHKGFKDKDNNLRKGRIRYNEKSDTLEFYYLDARGKERSKPISIDVFSKQEGYEQPMLESVEKLTVEDQTSLREMLEALISDKPAVYRESVEARNQIIKDLYENGVKRTEEIRSTLEKNKNTIQKIAEQIDNAFKTKTGQARKRISKALQKQIDTLLDIKTNLENENEQLMDEQADLEFNIPFFKDMLEEYGDFEGGSQNFLDQLKQDIKVMDDLIDVTKEAIKENKRMIDLLDQLFSRAVNLLNDYLQRVKEEFPGLPFSLEQLEANVAKFYGDEGAKNYIEQKLGFTEQVLELESTILDFEKELDVKGLDKKADQLVSELKELETGLDDLINRQIATGALLDKFQAFVDEQNLLEEEERLMAESKERKEELLATEDKKSVQNKRQGPKYEPVAKKPTNVIGRATMAPDTGKPHQKRANRFGARLSNIDKDTVFGVYVTLNNQDSLVPGLVQHLAMEEGEINDEVNQDSTIALLMVNSENIPIDEFGNPIDNEADYIEKGIYQVFPTEKLQWSEEFGGETMFRDKVDEKVKEQVIAQYAKWRNKILGLKEIGDLHSVDASFGIPEFVLDSEGQPDYDARATVQEAGLMTQDELESKQMLTIPKLETEGSKGLTKYANAIGKVFLNIRNSIVPLQNKKHSKEEATAIYDAILQLSKYAKDKTVDMSDPEPTRILNFLKSVVYWGIPIDGQGNKKPAGYNSIFFETDEVGKMMLTISNKGLDFTFSARSLARSKEEIIEAIMDIHNNVNSLMASKTNDSYEQITGIDENGEVQSIIWPNYQSYLLSDRMPAEDRTLTGAPRTTESIPLTTPMRPLLNDEDVNRRGIYFFTTDNADDYAYAEDKKKNTFLNRKKKETAKKTAAKKRGTTTATRKKGTGGLFGNRTTKSTSKRSPQFKNKKKTTTTKPGKGPFQNDTEDEEETLSNRISTNGTSVNFFKIKMEDGEKKVAYVVHPKVSAENLSMTIKFLTDAEDYEEVVEKLKKAGADPGEVLRKNIYKQIQAQEAFDEVDEEEEDFDDELEEIVKGNKTGKKDNDDTEEDEDSVMSERAKKIVAGLFTKSNKDEEYDDDEEDDDDIAMRELLLSETSDIEIEDWDAVGAWLKKVFPLVPVYIVKNIIQGPRGKQAWGALKNGAIYLYENAEVGTTYHEVFEAVWKMFSTPQERESILEEFKNREGKFLDRPSQKMISYKEATPEQIKEQLAEEFRDYIREGKVPVKPKDNRSFIVKLFSNIWSTIKNFFVGPNAETNTQKLFEKIGTGYYAKNLTPQEEDAFQNKGFMFLDNVKTTEEDALREKLKISDKQRSEIIEHMTYETLLELTQNDKSLFNDPIISKALMYDNIKIKLLTKIAKKIKGARKEYKLGNITKRRRNELIRNTANLIVSIDDEWDNLIDKHEEYLKGYNVEFDENDELQLNDEDKIKESDKFDATKIDSFKKANRAIKLLLSTIPYVREDGKFQPSSINGARLIPVSQVYITLLNNISESRNTDEMIENLRKLAENDINYRTLYKRLTKQDYSIENPSLDNITTQHGTQMITAFWSLFKKYNSIVKMLSVLDDGTVVVKNAYLSNAAEQLRKQYIDGIIVNAKSSTGFFKYDTENRVFVGVPSKVNSIDITGKAGTVKFLSALGIDFTTQELNRLEVQSPEDYDLFKKAVGGIKKSILNKEAIATFSSTTLSIGKRLYQIAEIKAKISNPEVDSTFFNINGDMTQSYIGPNIPSQLYEFLSSIKALDAENVGDDPQFSYLLTDNFSKGSVILKRMFDSKQQRKQRAIGESELPFAVGYSGGYENLMKGKSKQSSKLNYKERLLEELNFNLAGWYNNLVPGDASLGHIVFLGNEITYDKLSKGMSDVNLIFKDYFISEVLVSKEKNRPFIEVEGRKRTDLRFFKSILGEELHSEVVAYAKANTAEDTYKHFESKINSALNSYIDKNNESFKQTLTSYNIMKKDDEEANFVFENVGLPQNINGKQADLHLKAMTINYMIANIEMHKLLYSDPYQYSDELKRTKTFNSPRQLIVGGKDKINEVFDRVWNTGYEKGDIGYTNFTQPFFKTVVFKDISGFSSLLNYGTFKETDGSGIILYKAYRNLRLRASNWNDAEEKQYRYEVAWEKRDKAQIAEEAGDKELADKIYKTLSYEEVQLLDAGNPAVKSAFTTEKPINTGNKSDGKPFNDVIVDKFALYPLSYRVMKELNKDSNAVKLYNKMQNEDIDYVIFESARKVGSENAHSPYDAENNFNEAPFVAKGKGKNIVNVSFNTLSIQSDVPSKESALVRRGTQPTKLMTLDYMEGGIPLDFEEGKTFAERYESWYNLSEAEKLDKSELFRLITENQVLLQVMTDKGYYSLLKSLGIEEVVSTIPGTNEVKRSYKIDFTEAAVTLRDEILKRHVNDNISDALKGFLKGKSTLEATPAYQQIRNILYSIASREVISPKITGGMYVQIPVSFLESGEKIEMVDINGKKGYESKDLAFYSEEKDVDGKRTKVNVCEIFAGRWFDSKKTDAELIEYLNNTEEGQKILSGLAFRIPTQKQNSIDVFRIKRFLPKEFGNNVVIPSALVKKVGSDFDIDKLSLYLKNVKVDKNGYPKLIKFLDDSNSTVEDRYYDWILENSKRDTKNYIQYLSKSAISKLRKEFSESLEALKDKYSENISYKKEQLFGEYIDAINIGEQNYLTSQEEYIRNLFAVGKNLFFSLSDAEQTDYFLLRDSLKQRGIEGPKEIESYLILTQSKLETTDNEEDRDTLKDLITIYNEELRALGATEEYLTELKSKVLDLFRVNKDIQVGRIIEERNRITSELEESFKEQQTTHKMEVAEEMASIDGLLNINQFKDMSVYYQNTKKAVENQYIQSSQNLVSHPKNYDRLIQPNSADQLKSLSKKIAKKTIGRSFEYSNVGNMLDRTFMTALRHAFVSGKYAIGIAAVNQTNHSLNQRQLVFLDTAKLKELPIEDTKWIDDASIKFRRYNKVQVGKRMVTTLSMVKNAERNDEFPEGQDISDIIGQFIDGYVDISAGPWIMEFGATPNVTSTWLFLAKIGVPIDDIAYFMNQPIIRDYLKSIENDGYSYLFMDSYMKNTLTKFSKKGVVDFDALESKRKDFLIPNKKRLEASLDATVKSMSVQELEDQQIMLMEFLKYAKLSEQLFHVTQGTNFDTASFNDPYLVFKKLMQLDKARRTILSAYDNDRKIISAADALLKNSFIGNLSGNIENVRNALATILKSDQKKVRSIIQNVLTPYIDMNDRDFISLSQKAVNDFFDWAVQCKAGDGSINKDISKILIRRGGIGKEVLDFVGKIKKDINHPLHDNHVIKILEVKPSAKADEGGPTNIKIKGLDNKVYDQNNIIHAFREIKEYLQKLDPATAESKIYDKIKLLAVLQSGLSTSPISFTSVLPYEDFEDMYEEVISKIETIPNIEDYYKLGVFQKNNYYNDDIASHKKATYVPGYGYNLAMKYLPDSVRNAVKRGDIPDVMTQSVYTKEAKGDYIVYSWEKNIPAAKKKKMREDGDFSYINRGLFVKVRREDGLPYLHSYTDDSGVKKEYYVFKAVNAWGDSYRANEFYDHERPSVIDNGFIKVNAAKDSDIIAAFKSKFRTTTSEKVKTALEKRTTSDAIKALFGDIEESEPAKKPISKDVSRNVDDSASDKLSKAISNLFGAAPESEKKEISLRLRDGRVYTSSEINKKMLEAMGHTPLEIGKILDKIC